MSAKRGFDSQANEERFITIALRYLDGQNSPEEMKELQELLRVSPPHRDLFITISQQDSELQELFTYVDIDESSSNDLISPEKPSQIPLLGDLFVSDEGNLLDGLEGTCQCSVEQPPEDKVSILVLLFQQLGTPIPLTIMLFCVLFAPLAAITWVIWNGNANLPSRPISGRVSRAVACVWDDSKGATLSHGGLVVNNEQYILESGVLQIDLNSGAQAIIEGPAVFSTESSMRFILNEGRLSAKVPPEANNFTVATSGLEIVDRGTAFGVEIDGRSNADIHVFEGRVDAFTQHNVPNKPPKLLAMKSGQAAFVDCTNGTFEDCPIDASRFIRTVTSDTGMVTRLANQSFELPCVANHPETSKLSGNLHLDSIPGWKMSNNIEPFPTTSLQQAPFAASSTEQSETVPYNLPATDGEQVLGMRLYRTRFETSGGILNAWAYQLIGIPTSSDVGKVLTLEVDVAQQPAGDDLFKHDDFFVAKVAFTSATTPYQPGDEIGTVGIGKNLSQEEKSTTLVAKTKIGPHMVGQKLYTRLSLENTTRTGQDGTFHFDQVILKTSEPY